MEGCCRVGAADAPDPTCCPGCGRAGRRVELITLRALLKPAALERRAAVEHRFCPTPSCDVVYFGEGEVFHRGDVLVPVFQKEPEGRRTVCYCFAVGEEEVRRETEEQGRSASAARVAALVKAQRCACEVRNPQGSCCLGNVASVEKAARRRCGWQTEVRSSPPAKSRAPPSSEKPLEYSGGARCEDPSHV